MPTSPQEATHSVTSSPLQQRIAGSEEGVPNAG